MICLHVPIFKSDLSIKRSPCRVRFSRSVTMITIIMSPFSSDENDKCLRIVEFKSYDLILYRLVFLLQSHKKQERKRQPIVRQFWTLYDILYFGNMSEFLCSYSTYIAFFKIMVYDTQIVHIGLLQYTNTARHFLHDTVWCRFCKTILIPIVLVLQFANENWIVSCNASVMHVVTM